MVKVKLLLSDLAEFLSFFRQYLRKRLLKSFYRFELIKTKFVEKLYRQRGKYIRPFLHTSMIGLVLVGLMLAPLLKEAIFTEGEQGEKGINYFLNTQAYQDSAQTQVSVKPRDSIVSYAVLSGDTFSSIAQKFGVSVNTILWENSLKEKDTIKPGDIIKIPPVTGMVHKVKRGETVHSIAKKYSTEAQNIVNWPFNSFSNDEIFALSTGQLLIVPDGVKPAEKPIPVQRTYVAYKQITPDAGDIDATGSFSWPTQGYISQNPVWYHMAIDIANPAAPSITAADSGKVVATIYQKYAYGNHIIVDHGNGYQTLYAHLSQIYVNEGQTVGKGASLGKMGSTGRSTGIHLHFEVRKSGVLQNPLNYLK